MNFGETLYGMMYKLLSPFGMEDLADVRRAWDYFPFGDLTEAEQNDIQRAFEEKLQEIVAYLGENGLTIADLMENGEWKSGNEDFIGLLSQLARSIGSTYDSTTGALVFSADGSTINGVFPFVAVKAAAVATDKTYLVNSSTLSAIGDAIRAKEGTTEKYSPAAMAQKITEDLVKPSGTLQIKSAQQVDVRNYQYAKVTDANLTAGNIKKDVTILGIKGTMESSGGGAGFKVTFPATADNWDVDYYKSYILLADGTFKIAADYYEIGGKTIENVVGICIKGKVDTLVLRMTLSAGRIAQYNSTLGIDSYVITTAPNATPTSYAEGMSLFWWPIADTVISKIEMYFID